MERPRQICRIASVSGLKILFCERLGKITRRMDLVTASLLKDIPVGICCVIFLSCDDTTNTNMCTTFGRSQSPYGWNTAEVMGTTTFLITFQSCMSSCITGLFIFFRIAVNCVGIERMKVYEASR